MSSQKVDNLYWQISAFIDHTNNNYKKIQKDTKNTKNTRDTKDDLLQKKTFEYLDNLNFKNYMHTYIKYLHKHSPQVLLKSRILEGSIEFSLVFCYGIGIYNMIVVPDFPSQFVEIKDINKRIDILMY